MSPQSQFWIFLLRRSCLAGVDVSCSGFMEAGCRRSLGLRPMVNSMGVLSLKVTCVFLIVAALRINWAGICTRVIWCRFFEAVSTSTKRNFLKHPSQLGLAMVYAILSEVSSYCAFDRISACHEVDGRSKSHKSSSDSSEKCPSTHEA